MIPIDSLFRSWSRFLFPVPVPGPVPIPSCRNCLKPSPRYGLFIIIIPFLKPHPISVLLLVNTRPTSRIAR